MVRMTDPEGRAWHVGVRRLAWQPQPSAALRACADAALVFDDWLTCPIGGLAIAALIPLGLAHGLNWAASLAATPLVHYGRTRCGRPWTVVAFTDRRREYRGTAQDRAAARVLVERVAAEICRYGEPKALLCPDPPTGQHLGPSREPVPRPGPAWLHRFLDGLTLRLGPPPAGPRADPGSRTHPDPSAHAARSGGAR
jgi:hypothetical protein